MTSEQTYVALDVGHKRIGLALGDSVGRLARPLHTLTVDGTETIRLQTVLLQEDADGIVVGLPRNAAGQETQQSQAVRSFVTLRLQGLGLPVYFQDESVTSVLAEQHLQQQKKSYAKTDIDAMAAAIILQDFLEARHG